MAVVDVSNQLLVNSLTMSLSSEGEFLSLCQILRKYLSPRIRQNYDPQDRASIAASRGKKPQLLM